MSSPVEQIKEKLSIVDVVSSYVKLEKAGQHFRARCPFHNEKTPSFFVSPERNTFHCFGCSKGGDIFSFVQEIEGTTFPETIKLLADRAGIKLDTFEPGGAKEDVEMFRTLEYATIFFQKELEKVPDAKDYLRKRGITDSTIKEFRVGMLQLLAKCC
jgi:DNA primase